MPRGSTNLRRHTARRGTVYILVLAVTGLLVVLGVSGAMLSRVTVERSKLEQDQSEVRLAAESALDVTHKRINGTTAWRDSVVDDTWSAGELLGGTLVAVKYVDEIDGRIAGDPSQPFRLYARAATRGAVRIYSVEFIPDEAGNLRRNARTFQQETVD